MLPFVVVERRPTPGDEAWAAAGQVKRLARNLDMDRWEVAVALPEGSALVTGYVKSFAAVMAVSSTP
jgi:hypothetical protein